MSNERREKIEYYIILPIYFALALAIYGYAAVTVGSGLNIVFFMCYFAVNLMISIIFKLLENEKWDIAVSFAASVILALIFRDRILITNIITAFVVTALIYALRSQRVKRYGWAVLTAALIILWLTSGIEMPRYVAISLIALILYSLTVAIERDIRYFVAIPFFIALITIFTPVKEEPIQWLFVKNTVQKVGDAIDHAVDSVVYFVEGFGFESDTSYTGYSGNGKITGGVSSYDTEELSFVNSTSPRKTIMYLKGRSLTKLDKDGFSDPDTDDESINAWFALYMNALYHSDVDAYEAAFFSKVMTGFFKYEYLRTEDIITPPSPLYIYDRDDEDGELKLKEQGYTYKVRYIQIDYGSPYYAEIVNAADPNEKYEPYDVITKYTKKLYNIDFTTVMSEEEYLDAFAERDMSKYLDASMATDRIVELTEDITKGAKTDYEKAYKIEEYLRQYEYDRSVDLTSSDNYIDDFLFVEQKGYCVHYASAMVLMLRVAGIPSRYSVGYRHNEKKASDVMSAEAHSWPEAYIDGFGWVPFEPTAAMFRPVEYSWGLGDDYDGFASSEQDPWVDEWLKMMQDPQSQEADLSESGIDSAGLTDAYYEEGEQIPQDAMIDPAEIQDVTEQETRAANPRSSIIKFVGYIGMLIGAVLAILAIIWFIGIIRYGIMKPEEKLRENVRKIMKILDKYSVPTGMRFMEEYPKLIEDEEKKEDLETLFKSYSRIRFRGDDVDEETVEKSKTMYRYVKKCYS